MQNKDKIVITWTINDIIGRASDIGKGKISKCTARLILSQIKKNHDSTIGINWNTIDDAIIDNVK